MSQSRDRSTASGILTELDSIRSLLGESAPDEAIPLLEDTVDDAERDFPIVCDAATAATELPLEPTELERIPLLDDPIPDFEDDEFDQLADDDTFAAEDGLMDSGVTEPLAAQALQTAVRNRVDEILDHWVNETLQQELTLLRAQVLEAVQAEIHEYVAAQIDRVHPTGKPHGE